MEWVSEDLNLREKTRVFKDRKDAGLQLAESLMSYSASGAMVFSIPAGGVQVAAEVCRLLSLRMDALVVRKIQMPDDPEAGIGAVGPNGTVVLNDYIIEVAHLAHEVIERQIERAKQSVSYREGLFRKSAPYPNMNGKTIVLIDDGLASGFTMLAAIKFVRSRGAKKVVVAVPTGSERAVEMVKEKADEVHCLNVRSAPFFAVADAYKYWYDLTDDEALSVLKANQ